MSNTKRIAKNTLLLYFRLIIVMLISLYTVRVVLDTLGTEDYGIYNVAAGIVTMFGFLSGTMSLATQRFLSLEMGKDDSKRLKLTFSAGIIIYLIIAIIVVIISETAGLWFLNNKMAIPQDRMNATRWIYQFAIASFIFTLLTTPYIAAVLAHEDMHIYAVLSIIKSLLDLGIVIILQFISWDKLKLYGMLLSIIPFIQFFIYKTICQYRYDECKGKPVFSGNILKEMIVYNGWMLFGPFSGVFKNQITNILLNQFFNPGIVAVRSIAAQVNNAVSSFFMGFNMALRPSMIKSYAAMENDKLLSQIFLGTKGNFFLMYVFMLPLMLEMPMVLSLWLKNVPEHTILFTQLMLLETLLDALAYPMNTAIIAGNKIKLYELLGEGILLLNFPLVLTALLWGAPVYSVMIIAVIIRFIAFILRFFIIKQSIVFPVTIFLKTVLLPIFIVAATAAVLPILVHFCVRQGFFRLLLSTGLSVASVCGSMYFFGINKSERGILNEIVQKKLLFLCYGNRLR
jgi:O-antigen/teichoic acid export membrane protein